MSSDNIIISLTLNTYIYIFTQTHLYAHIIMYLIRFTLNSRRKQMFDPQAFKYCSIIYINDQ